MPDIAIGTTVFNRAEKIRTLLESADNQIIKTVYVADNGNINKTKRNLYEKDYPFQLVILDIEYDAGLAYSRNRIVDALEEELLLLVDCDMLIPNNVDILYEQLNSKPNIGGISGILQENRTIRGPGHNLYEESLFTHNDLLIRDIQGDSQVETISNYRFIELDKIPNATLFRKECFEDYSWDPNYKLGEHLDFFLGHKKETEWSFGSTPDVIFPHNPGGYPKGEKPNRKTKIENAKTYFENKWGYRHVIHKTPNWLESHIHNIGWKRLFLNQFTETPPKFQGICLEALEKIR
jgi:glycosyltransferase involved in cell wall biosynthesis